MGESKDTNKPPPQGKHVSAKRLAALERLDELFQSDSGLTQGAAERANGKLFVQREGTTGLAPAQDYMTSPLPNLTKPHSLQYADRLLAGNPG